MACPQTRLMAWPGGMSGQYQGAHHVGRVVGLVLLQEAVQGQGSVESLADLARDRLRAVVADVLPHAADVLTGAALDGDGHADVADVPGDDVDL